MLDQIVTKLTINVFADDHSIRTECKPSRLGKDKTETIKIMESSMLAVKDWMDSVCLKINESKTEFIYFRSTSQLVKCNITQIDVNGAHIERSDKTRYLGAQLYRTFSMKDHVKTKFEAAMIKLQQIKSARKLLSRKNCETLVISLVISNLDFANGLLVGLPKSILDQLQQYRIWQ